MQHMPTWTSGLDIQEPTLWSAPALLQQHQGMFKLLCKLHFELVDDFLYVCLFNFKSVKPFPKQDIYRTFIKYENIFIDSIM